MDDRASSPILSLFTFAMLMLVTSDNLLQMFFGWEGVGLASYLLIGFWFKKPSANAAAIKAFIVNRVGDFGFALGIFGLFAVFGSVQLDAIFAAAPAIKPARRWSSSAAEVDIMTCLCLLLFMGAMGKSAQFLLHTWLPDAMEGPTPVSALIHAATMVTAGVFMVASACHRCSNIAPDSPPGCDVCWHVDRVLCRDRSVWCRTISSVSWPIRRARSSDTCSPLADSAPTRSRYSICSRMHSSRRCCSSAQALSSMPCTMSRICATWVALAPKIRITWAHDADRNPGTHGCRDSTRRRLRGFPLQRRHH